MPHSGASLIFYYGFGVSITASANCTFIGFTLDSFPPNYAQGTVQSLDGSNFVARFDNAFIPPSGGPFGNAGGLHGAKVAFWDATTKRMLPEGNQFMVNASLIPIPNGGFSTGSGDISSGSGGAEFTVSLASKVRGPIIPGVTPVTIFPRRGFTWHIFNSSHITTYFMV